ncbi:MAG: DUF885 domain-containing protein [Acidimicrobiales bacterium]
MSDAPANDIFRLSSDAVELLADHDPMLATHVGLPGRDHRWSDFSPAGVAARRLLLEEILAAAESAPVDDHRSVVAQRVLATEMRNEIAAIDSELWRRDLNNIDSPWQNIREIFELMPVDSLDEWTSVVARLETIEHPLAGYRASLTVGLEAGDVVARRQVLTAIEQGRVTEGETSSFFLLQAAFDDAELDRDDPAVDALARRLAAGIDSARRAYGAMTDWFESTYLPAARDIDGVGREAWLASATPKLGTVVDPIATYEWGWDELARLIARRAEVARQIDPTATVDDVLARVIEDPELVAPDADAFVAIMQERQDAAVAALDGSHFDVPAEIKTVEVRMAPPGGATAAHYLAPSEDFSRAGRVMYPPAGRTVFPLYEEVTTAYHEGFPGHHLQVGWQMAMGDALSRLHRLLVWYPGSGEGWALYAEHLMGELGFLERPEYELGLLTSQIFRSARIVIDIGCHLGLTIPDSSVTTGAAAVFDHAGETWDFDLGLEMLTDVVHLEPTNAESEMVRYLGWPGQAISYKLGERFLLDLREEMSAAPDFDLKAWHAKVLSLGSLGIDLLDELMRA